MTEKELHKLRKQDFLQLLLTQGKEMSELQTELDETIAELEDKSASNERLIAKLDEKDELIEKLKGRLDEKDATILSLEAEIEDNRGNQRIELENAGSIAMAALKLNGIFEAAQTAADQYLESIRLMYEEQRQLHPELEEIPKPTAKERVTETMPRRRRTEELDDRETFRSSPYSWDSIAKEASLPEDTLLGSSDDYWLDEESFESDNDFLAEDELDQLFADLKTRLLKTDSKRTKTEGPSQAPESVPVWKMTQESTSKVRQQPQPQATRPVRERSRMSYVDRARRTGVAAPSREKSGSYPKMYG